MISWAIVTAFVLGCPDLPVYLNDGSKTIEKKHAEQIFLSAGQCKKSGTGDCLVEIIFQPDHVYAVCGPKKGDRGVE